VESSNTEPNSSPEPGKARGGSRRFVRVAAPLVAAAAIGAGVAVAVDSSTSSGGQPTAVPSSVGTQPAALAKTLSAEAIYDKTAAGVVELDVSSSAGLGPLGDQQAQGEGSGFVIDKQGRIVTNAHVVEGANSITVKFQDGSTAKATLVGSDPSTDVAVVKVNVAASKLKPLTLGNSSDVEPGQGVVAIGSPFGLEGTITAGIVSAVHRTIQAPDGSRISSVIQTDAAINKGNSGGPLLNAQGEVIGINSQIEGDSGGNVGVGFAVPINTARQIASQLISSGKVEHAFLGVQVESVTTPIFGARIRSVEAGSAAAKAGLRAGDVIGTVDGKSVTTSEALQSAIASHKPGDKITLGISRGGNRTTVTATLGSRSS
jgi:putative serine protease PepD